MSRSSKRDERVRKPTRERLAVSLKNAGASERMIDAAQRGMYDWCLSPLTAPIAALIHDARREKLEGIVIRALSGEFDAQEWEREEWMRQPEMVRQIKEWNGFIAAMHRGGMIQ